MSVLILSSRGSPAPLPPPPSVSHSFTSYWWWNHTSFETTVTDWYSIITHAPHIDGEITPHSKLQLQIDIASLLMHLILMVKSHLIRNYSHRLIEHHPHVEPMKVRRPIFSVALQPKASPGRLVLKFLNKPQLDTHPHPADSSERAIRWSQSSLLTRHTTNTRGEHPCPQRDSNLRSQQSGCCIPTA